MFFAIETDVPPNVRHYQMIIGDFPSCSYFDFVKMFMVALGKTGDGCITIICTTSFAMLCIAIAN
jgi:hypothetical protein